MSELLQSYSRARQPLSGELGGVLVRPQGPTDARVAVVGASPGETEEFMTKAFVGPDFDLLKDTAKGVGLPFSMVWRTYVCKYRRLDSDHSATYGQMMRFRRLLIRELTALSPRVVVALGKDVTCVLTGLKKSSTLKNLRGREWVGFRLPVATKVVATYAPHYVDRMGGFGCEQHLEQQKDLKWAAELANG